MLDNCTYDKVKILHELSCLLWFIQKHADKEIPENDGCHALLKDLEKDLEKYVAAFKEQICK